MFPVMRLCWFICWVKKLSLSCLNEEIWFGLMFNSRHERWWKSLKNKTCMSCTEQLDELLLQRISCNLGKPTSCKAEENLTFKVVLRGQRWVSLVSFISICWQSRGREPEPRLCNACEYSFTSTVSPVIRLQPLSCWILPKNHHQSSELWLSIVL